MAFGIDDAVAFAANVGGKIIDRLWPDPAQAAAAKLKLFEMQQTGELARLTAETDLLKGQLAINQVEAANPNVFVAGWRPSVGWTCSLALAFQLVFAPLATWAATLAGHPVAFPPLDTGATIALLGSLLGVGSMRTAEKIKGIGGH